MFINWMAYENKTTGQKIERLNFERMNLLVGPSAAGKTQILKVLSDFLQVAVYGQAIPTACHFQIGFQMSDNPYAAEDSTKSFVWEIETGSRYSLQGENDKPAHQIVKEQLTSGEETFFSRHEQEIRIKDYDRIPAIAKDKSILYVFQGNRPFDRITQDMRLVSSFYKQGNAFEPIPVKWMNDLADLFPTKEEPARRSHIHMLAESILPIGADIHIAKLHMPDLYDDFLLDVQDVFPEIEGIELVSSTVFTGKYVLGVKIDGRDIEQQNVSSGMLRTIWIFALLHFRCRHTTILFDELENSLGINCLDSVVERIRLKAAEEGTQFILTSHHPYIINQIPVNDWLLISQKKGVITGKKAADVGIGKTSREQFVDLLNYMLRQKR
ncbi:AAA family ATPase [Mitsuokella sp. WILCCON 0060]|uniref:AAA family ATPase n=1 Tax=Mitsuokella sp. WILCCON 0060 TaxID=3345341 RepID=UPI003F1AE107